MLAMWPQIEADFRRDYGIDLARELGRMSWRSFAVLLMGLGPDGAVARDYEKVMRQCAPDDAAGLAGLLGAGSGFSPRIYGGESGASGRVGGGAED